MMTAGTSSAAAAVVAPPTPACVCDRISRMYSHVNEEECPLPRAWSHQDKFTYLGLSQNNLRVHYKGVGKSHKDAASVRATHPIPPACGLYYFEVKVVSKGRDGYIGIGLCAQGVNMNKLPGWEKSSYGYHADDGNSFCSSGAGESYGPTFTTGDVIGCGVNFVNNTCFYTKNGINLGIAFRDLIPNLYPTVGLQTLGEIVDANFGQQPFVFDIDEMRKELSASAMQSIGNFPTPSDDASWKSTMQKIVSSYLVHCGYSATVEAFSKASGQSVDEDISSIRNRQRVQKLVLAGRMSEAIDETNNLYPGLLEKNTNLMFQLKCRQFVEMVSGSDGEAKPLAHSPTRSTRNSPAVSMLASPSISTRNSPCASPARSTGTNLLTTTTADSSGNGFLESVDESVVSDDEEMDVTAEEYITSCQSQSNGATTTTTLSLGNSEHVGNGVCGTGTVGGTGERDGEMILSEEEEEEEGSLLASSSSPGASILQRSQSDSGGGGGGPIMRQLCGGNLFVIEKLLAFGKSLQETYDKITRDHGPIPECETLMKEAFSLLAYNNPHESPVAHLLNNEQREVVATTLNSAILECHSFPRQPALSAIIGQSRACLKAMAQHGLGSCAFVNTEQLYKPI